MANVSLLWAHHGTPSRGVPILLDVFGLLELLEPNWITRPIRCHWRSYMRYTD